MTDAKSWEKGFSFIEIMVVVAIVMVLATVATVSLSALRERTALREAAGTLVFHLEESKARAVAGVGGQPHGVHFAEGRYVQFRGTEYVPNDPANVIHDIDPALRIVADILNGEDEVIFSRITGRADSAASITISLEAQPENQKVILIGAGGDISYQE